MPILVNFHLHSNFSDGDQTPEAIAAGLAAAGVRYAALTDHDTLESWPRFEDSMKKRGLACLPGVELTTSLDGRELHLLGYGFDPRHPDLLATLLELRQAREVEVHSIAGSLRRRGVNLPNAEDAPAVSAAPGGKLEASAAIDLVQRAGGRVFWAHPLASVPDLPEVEQLVVRLKALGLDGLEALYTPFSESQRASLVEIAQRHGLLISAGTDFHSGGDAFATEMPHADWMRFRGALFASPTFSGKPSSAEKTSPGGRAPRHPAGSSHPPHFEPQNGWRLGGRRRSYILRIFLPTLIAIGLFLAAIWGLILPSFEQTLLERKRELIRELTNSAWSILASYERDEQSGLLTREQAQAQAIARVEALRYGPEGLDYFWIQDLTPRMIMHPYRSDLNGQELLSFTDQRGVRAG